MLEHVVSNSRLEGLEFVLSISLDLQMECISREVM